MNKYLTVLTLFAFLGICPEVSAQTFMRRSHIPAAAEPVQAQSPAADRTTAAGQTDTDEAELTPEELAAIENKLNARVTAAEKVDMQAPIRKSNKIVSRNMRPEEARRLVDAFNAIEKIKARRANLASETGALQKAEKTDINVSDSKQIEQLLNQKTLGDELQNEYVSANQNE